MVAEHRHIPLKDLDIKRIGYRPLDAIIIFVSLPPILVSAGHVVTKEVLVLLGFGFYSGKRRLSAKLVQSCFINVHFCRTTGKTLRKRFNKVLISEQCSK